MAIRIKVCVSCGGRFRNFPGLLCRMCKVGDNE